jgi:hypothetical protein
MKTVATLAWSQLSTTNLRSLIDAQPLLYSGDENLQGFFDPLLKDVENESIEAQHAYAHVINLLGSIYAAIQKQEPGTITRRRILGMPAMVPQKFVELMQAHDPRTMAILAQYFGMMKLVEDIWWLKGMAVREITGIFSALPKEWHWALECSMRPIKLLKPNRVSEIKES